MESNEEKKNLTLRFGIKKKHECRSIFYDTFFFIKIIFIVYGNYCGIQNAGCDVINEKKFFVKCLEHHTNFESDFN